MDTTIWILIGFGALFLLFVLFYSKTFFVRIAGTWYEQKEPGGPVTEIQLSQIGPFVSGYAPARGGHHEYKGWFNGKQLKIKRKDYGEAYFQGINIQEPGLIRELEGSEMARLELEYNRQTQTLEGCHFPQRIDISKTKPKKILGRVYIQPQPRQWTRRAPR